MGIAVAWDDEEHTILLYVFESPWTWDDYSAAIATAWKMVGRPDYRTDTITDMSRSRAIPDQVFRSVRKSIVEIPKTMGLIVIVGGGVLVTTLLDILRRVHRPFATRLRLARSVEEARALIAEDRAQGS